MRSERVYAEIDWSLLLMFAGLFIVVAGAGARAADAAQVVAAVGQLHLDRVPVLSAVTAVLSNLVSNVPAVLVLKPFVAPLHDPARAWLTVAMASTLAGNFTVLGSVANLIVVQRAAARGVVDRLLGLFRRRRAADAADDRVRHALADALSVYPSPTQGWRSSVRRR